MRQPNFKSTVRGRVSTGGATTLADWDARYLGKYAGAPAQSVNPAVTFASLTTHSLGWVVTLGGAQIIAGGMQINSGGITVLAGGAYVVGPNLAENTGAPAFTFRRTNAGTVLNVRNTGDSADVFTVSDIGGFTANAASTVNVAAASLNALQVQLSGATTNSGLTPAGVAIAARSANGFAELISDRGTSGNNYRGQLRLGASSTNYMGFSWDDTNTRIRLFNALSIAAGNLVDLENIVGFNQVTTAGSNTFGLRFTSDVAAGANIGFKHDAPNNPVTIAGWFVGASQIALLGNDQSFATVKFTGMGTGFSNGTVLLRGTTAAGGAFNAVTIDNNGTSKTAGAILRLNDAGTGSLFMDIGGVTYFNNSGLVSKYNNTTTAGLGVVANFGSGYLTGQTGAVSTVATFTPAAQGTFQISCYVNVTAWTTPASFNLQVTYTDDGGTSRTTTIPVFQTAGTVVVAINATGVWQAVSFTIRANAAAITIKTAGTFTGSPTYNVDGEILQMRG